MTHALDVRAHDTLARETVEIRRVLVPLDGTRFAERALPVACGLAHAYRAEVLLVHIGAGQPRDDRPGRRLWPIPRHPYDDIHAMSLYLARQESALRGQGVRAHSRLVRVGTGDVSGTLARICEQMGADLLVLATHAGPGSKTFARTGLPLAGAVLRDAALPVLLVGSATANPFALAVGQGMTVLLPLRPDTTSEQHAGLGWATTLARQSQGQVALLVPVEDSVLARGETGSDARPRDLATVRRDVMSQIERVRAEWSASDVPIWATLAPGDLMAEAARQARGRADLIVLPFRHGEGEQGRIQQAFELFRRSNVPVLLAPDTKPGARSRRHASAALHVEEANCGDGPSW